MSQTFTFRFPDGAPEVFHVHLYDGADTEAVLAAIEALSATTEHLGAEMAVDLSSLTAAVEQSTTVEQSAITLIEQIAAQVTALAAQLEAQGVDPAALQALADQLNAGAASLGDAIVANTPAAP